MERYFHAPNDATQYINKIRKLTSQDKKKITILGAGIAGLVAGYELKKLGHDVEILEANNRIGGRIWTHYFDKEQASAYGELGAMRIPIHHYHTLFYIDELGLKNKLKSFIPMFQDENCFIDMYGYISKIKDIPQNKILIKSLSGQFLLKNYDDELAIAKLKIAVDAISPFEIREIFNEYFKNDFFSDYSYCKKYISSLEKIKIENFINQFLLFAKIESKLKMFLTDISTEISDLVTLDGGMNQLPEKLAFYLKNSIFINTPIHSIENKNNKAVQIKFSRNGVIETKQCDYLICTIPFSILRKIELINFSIAKQNIIDSINYVSASKLLLFCKRAFWNEKNYRIRGGGSASDQIIRQVFYPTETPNPVLLASYALGKDASYLSSLSDKMQINLVKTKISRFHAEIFEPDMIISHALVNWESHQWTQGGCCFHWPQDIDRSILKTETTKLFQDAIKPEGKIFFAGEHCSGYNAWIEGAVISALRSVDQVTTLFNQENISPYFSLTTENKLAFV